MSVSNKIGLTRIGVTEKQGRGTIWANKETVSRRLDLCKGSCTGTGRTTVHLHFNSQPQEWAPVTKSLCSSHHWAHTWHLSGMTCKFAWSAPGRPIEMSAQHLLALGPLGFYSQSRAKSTSDSTLEVFEILRSEKRYPSTYMKGYLPLFYDSQNTGLRTACVRYYY